MPVFTSGGLLINNEARNIDRPHSAEMLGYKDGQVLRRAHLWQHARKQITVPGVFPEYSRSEDLYSVPCLSQIMPSIKRSLPSLEFRSNKVAGSDRRDIASAIVTLFPIQALGGLRTESAAYSRSVYSDAQYDNRTKCRSLAGVLNHS